MLYNGIATPFSSMTNASFFSTPNLPLQLRLYDDLPQALENFTPSVSQCQTSGSIYSKRWPLQGLTLPGTHLSLSVMKLKETYLPNTASISTVRCFIKPTREMVPHCLTPRIAVGVTNPSRGVLDFNDWRALQPIFDAAKLAGIFVVLRPGKCFVILRHYAASD